MNLDERSAFDIQMSAQEETGLSTIQERAEARKRTATVKKFDLHSKEHHSFYINLDATQAWELLAKLSKERWMEETGLMAPGAVDKSVCKIIRPHQRQPS